MDRRRFAVATLFALILLILIFVPLVAQQAGVYDPWLDYNGDGVIDVNDLTPLGQAYGTSGDPTRNVSVTNFPLDEYGNIRVNMADTKPLQTYRDSFQITLMDHTVFKYVWVVDGLPLTCPFAFNPKGESVNVTDFWITFARMTATQTHLQLTLNGLVTVSYFLPSIPVDTHQALHITDISFYKAFKTGVNYLTLTILATDNSQNFNELMIFIEYEYLA